MTKMGQEEILKALTNEWQGTNELIKKTGTPRNRLLVSLNKMLKYGEIALKVGKIPNRNIKMHYWRLK